MGLLNFFRSSNKSSAAVARDRLQVIVAHQRGQREGGHMDYLPTMQREMLEVIRKYVAVDDDAVRMEVDRDGDLEVLEVNIVLPDQATESN